MRLPPVTRAIKRFLPTSLFARALLILFVPLVLLQVLVAHIFYERHWDSVARNMAGSLAGDIALLTREYVRSEAKDGDSIALEELRRMGMALNIGAQRIHDSDRPLVDGAGSAPFPEFYENLQRRLKDTPVMILDEQDAGRVRVRVGLEQGMLEFAVSRKRLASSTTYIFIFWMVGFSALLMLVATLFLRNQIRPIVQLARAAEQFGLGYEVVEFTTRGASEIKRAASAFRTMADRIRRSVTSRTEMLAGISHDLRTPLTRMKLEIEMGKIDQATRDALEADIDEMRGMIDEYLDFARGDAGEPMEPVDLHLLLQDVVDTYTRQRRPVSLGACEHVQMMLRPQAIRRALTNLIDNALRYGKTAQVELELTLAFARIKITDTGPGIAEMDHETVFKPFTRLEASRNVKTGGVGLGLSIARDIAQSHGGTINLENQRDSMGSVRGLEVTIRLPRGVNV
ncbi:MAG: two-component sensor histidine kinase [Azospirillum brasilense]|nr:MAG: two-component sensor histidine kinase [Azospirillum brasilense]